MSTKKNFSRELSANVADKDAVKKIIDGYLVNNYIKNFSLYGYKDSYDDYREDDIVLLSHIFHPIRRIGRIALAPDAIKVAGLHPALQYCFFPLLDKDVYMCADDLVFNERKPMNLITKRRGCWVIHKTIKFEETESETIHRQVGNAYRKYVKLMSYNPPDIKSSDRFFQQFDLDIPYKKPWKQGVYKKRKSQKPPPSKIYTKTHKSDFKEIIARPNPLTRSTAITVEAPDYFYDSLYGSQLPPADEDEESEDSQNKVSMYKEWEDKFGYSVVGQKRNREDDDIGSLGSKHKLLGEYWEENSDY